MFLDDHENHIADLLAEQKKIIADMQKTLGQLSEIESKSTRLTEGMRDAIGGAVAAMNGLINETAQTPEMPEPEIKNLLTPGL